MTNTDPHSVLGIARTATAEEAKAAYRKLAMKYHPDRNQGDKAAEERFKEITAAYDAIVNPKPTENNGPGAGFGGFGGFAGSPFDPDFWKQGFGDKAKQRTNTHTRPGAHGPSGRTTENPDTASWATMFGGQAAPESADLKSKFNAFAHFVNNAVNLRRAAHNEYARRNPTSIRTVKDLAASAPEIHMAEQLFDTLTRRETAVTLMNDVSGAGPQDQAVLEKRIAQRQMAVINALDVMAGRTDKLRFKPRDAGADTLALKL